ncbi:MAG: TIGR01212 family radical SAM protein, partial [Firmicutes bacterium CAG:272_52_7]
QVFTNTYAPVERLRELYYAALSLPETVGLSIATRADCIDGEKPALLREISEKTYLTVELGLQTVHESTAALINRGHTYEEFLAGYEKLRGLNVCVHLINGLPGENEEMMLESARSVAALRPHSVKIHMLYLERGCRMAEDYLASPFHILTGEEYISVTVSQLELFHPDTVIGRLTGDGMAQNLIAPLWSEKKFCVLNGIDKEFVRRGSFQGREFFGALPQTPPLS